MIIHTYPTDGLKERYHRRHFAGNLLKNDFRSPIIAFLKEGFGDRKEGFFSHRKT